MKTFFINTIIVLCLFTITSCDILTSKQIPNEPKQELILVVKDQSASVSITRKTQKKEKQLVKQFLQQHLKSHTDIALLQVNTYSADRTNTQWIRYQAPRKQTTNRVQSKKQKALQESLYQGKVYQVFKKMTRKALKKLYANNPQQSKKTAILEVLFSISELSKNYDKVQVLFISDMIQESSLQNFTTSSWPMPSKKYALALAKKDSNKLLNQGLTIDLSKIDGITVFVPENANPAHFVNMPFYWEELFKTKGYQTTVSWEKIH